MLRIRVLGASAALLVASAGIAAAADIPPYGAPPPGGSSFYNPVPVSNWTGPYVGLIGGYGWAGPTVPNRGWLGGAFVGANFQTDSTIVVGIEADVTATGKTGMSGGTTVTNPWNTTLRGRVGFAMDRFMVYGTGGVAVGRVAATGAITGATTRVGWTAGAGVEAQLSQQLLGRVEYRHTNLGTAALTGGPVTYRSDDVMVGVGLKF